jgi:shikimate dehydrogenase
VIKAAVLGSPIAHSLSPRLHTAAYEFLKIEGTYTSFDVPAGTLKSFLSDKSDSWTGFSLTMPLKEEALHCVDAVDPLVQRIQSGNTLVKESNGWQLFSTDVLGFRNAWRMHNANNPTSVVIIGSGATARAALAAFDTSGTKFRVVHRNSEREESMKNCLVDSSIEFHPWNFHDFILQADLVINTTPKLALDGFSPKVSNKPEGTFFDVIYNPWPTQFANAWRQEGGKVIGGLDLLIAQGVEQIKLFSKSKLSTDELTKYLRQELAI